MKTLLFVGAALLASLALSDAQAYSGGCYFENAHAHWDQMHSDLQQSFIHEVYLNQDELNIIYAYGGATEMWATDYSNCSDFTVYQMQNQGSPPSNYFANYTTTIPVDCNGHPFRYDFYRGFMARFTYTDWSLGFPIESTVDTHWPQEPINCAHKWYETLWLAP